MADQDQSELPSMEKGRDLKLPPQVRLCFAITPVFFFTC